MKIRLPSLRIVLTLAVAAVAGWLLYRELRTYSLREILDGLAAIPAQSIAVAVGLTVVNYAILVGYDWLAVRSIRHPLPLRKIALASFCGHAVSYNFGALLGGGSVRYRLYAAWGLSAVEIVQLLAMLGITFWVGAFALAGVVLLVAPPPIPADLHLPFENARPVGAVCLAVAAGYLGLSALRRRPITVRGHTLSLPTLQISTLQLVIAAVDLVVAAAVLYTLLPDALGIGFAAFCGVYLLAVVTVLITHVPGGLGVFEVVVLSLLPGEEQVMASLLVFRVIYLLLPLLLAMILLATHEVHLSIRRGGTRGMETAAGPAASHSATAARKP